MAGKLIADTSFLDGSGLHVASATMEFDLPDERQDSGSG
jgi:hypothetical protein